MAHFADPVARSDLKPSARLLQIGVTVIIRAALLVDIRSPDVASVARKGNPMRLNPLFAILVFGAGFTTGLIARSPSVGALQGKDTKAADLAAIEKLHQKDIAVTLAQDPQGLIDIWTEDAVRYSLDPKSPPTTSKQAIAAENQKDRAANPEFKVLSYVPRFKDIQVSGNLACELFEADAQFRLSRDGPPENWHGKGIRVLRRQSDQSWKFVALIWD